MFEIYDNIAFYALNYTENLLELVLKAGDIFHAWPFGKLLSGYGESFLHIFKAYIRDMVYMSHPVQSEEESNVSNIKGREIAQLTPTFTSVKFIFKI